MPRKELRYMVDNIALFECDKLLAELASFRPIEKRHLKQIRAFWRVGLTYSSNALEGNTLTESETKVILEDGLTIGGKSVREHMEAIGHADALNYLYQVVDRKEDFDEDQIQEIHRLFYHRIDDNQAGKYRGQNVLISGTQYIPPDHKEVLSLMSKFLDENCPYQHPIERASWYHAQFVNIHPFVDGNGRTARLLINLELLKNGYPIVAIPPIYRAQYIQACERGNQGDFSAMTSLLSGVTKQSLIDYLRQLRKLA